MSVPPTSSPWPAPTLADAAPSGPGSPSPSRDEAADDVIAETRGRRQVAAALDAARRLVDPVLRAEHVAAKEEQKIRNELGDLPAGWFVLPASEVEVLGDEDVGGDGQFVVGPGGVFSIRIEHHPAARVWVSERTMTVNGRTTDHLSKARFEARRAGGRLTDQCGFHVTVQSVVVMIGAAVQTVSRPAEVHVRGQHDLRDWLCVQPRRLDPAAVATIHQLVGRGSSTTTGICRDVLR